MLTSIKQSSDAKPQRGTAWILSVFSLSIAPFLSILMFLFCLWKNEEPSGDKTRFDRHCISMAMLKPSPNYYITVFVGIFLASCLLPAVLYRMKQIGNVLKRKSPNSRCGNALVYVSSIAMILFWLSFVITAIFDCRAYPILHRIGAMGVFVFMIVQSITHLWATLVIRKSAEDEQSKHYYLAIDCVYYAIMTTLALVFLVWYVMLCIQVAQKGKDAHIESHLSEWLCLLCLLLNLPMFAVSLHKDARSLSAN